MKRILLSLTIIAAVVSLAGGATLALWTDTAVSSNNTFAAGYLNLKLSDDNETDQENVTLSWNVSDMVPGTTHSKTLNIKNTGSPASNHIHLTLSNSITEDTSLVDAASSDPVTNYLQIIQLTLDGTDITGLIADSQANGYKDLADFVAAGTIGAHTGASKLSLSDLNTNHPLVMTVKLHDDSPNQNQKDTVASTVTVLLHQRDSQ